MKWEGEKFLIYPLAQVCIVPYSQYPQQTDIFVAMDELTLIDNTSKVCTLLSTFLLYLLMGLDKYLIM